VAGPGLILIPGFQKSSTCGLRVNQELILELDSKPTYNSKSATLVNRMHATNYVYSFIGALEYGHCMF
jgi:hypothetical protein